MKLFGTSDDTTAEDETAQTENGDMAMSQETTQSTDGTTMASDPSYQEPGTTTYEDGGTTAYQDGETTADTDTDTEQSAPTFTPADATTDDIPVTTADGSGTAQYDAPADEAPAMDEPETTYPADEPAVASSAAADSPAYDSASSSPAAPASPYVPPAATPAAPASPYEPTAAAPATAAQPAAAVQPDAVPMDEPAAAAFTSDEHLIANTAGMRASWQQVQAEFVDDPKAAVMGAADLIEQTAQSLLDALQERQRTLRGAVAGSDADAAAANAVPDTEHLRQMMQRYRTLFDQLCNA